jgi:transcription elongation GreA/GreB family factor
VQSHEERYAPLGPSDLPKRADRLRYHMSRAFTKEDDDAGVELKPTGTALASGRFRITARGAESLARKANQRWNELAERAEILPPIAREPERATLGVTVQARAEDGSNRSYRLVTSEEQALTGEGCSINSPLGQALLGSEVGDVCEVRTPRGREELEITALAGD